MPNNGVTFDFVAGGRAAGSANVLLVPLTTKPKPALTALTKVDALCDDAVSELLEVGAIGEEAGQLGHSTRSGQYRRIVVIGLGDDAELTPPKLRDAAGAAVKWLVKNKVKQAALWIDGLLSSNFERPLHEWALGMTLAGFRFDQLKKPDEKAIDRCKVQLLSSDSNHVARAIDEMHDAVTLGAAVNYARRIAHQPPNLLNPTTLAAEAESLAKEHKLKCTVFDAAQARKMGMNGLLAVGVASTHKPCLIRLDYNGSKTAATTTVVVGKSITFDTGGISIKPAAGMEAMKFDKCGGMAVLGLMKAVATLKLRCNVIGLLAAAENTISGDAYRPSDIIRMMSGKTVEVTNTDAEGRMVLADALWYAQKNCKPTALINLATLTGGVVTALGKCAAGIMSNDESLADELVECGRRTHERLWPLPLWDDYKELIKSSDADIKNSSGKRYAHPIVGGMFLKEFIEKGVPWAHLDIAGTATTEDEKAATGFGVRLLVEYLRRRISP